MRHNKIRKISYIDTCVCVFIYECVCIKDNIINERRVMVNDLMCVKCEKQRRGNFT